MAFSKLRQFFFGGSKDPHSQRAGPEYDAKSDTARKGAVDPNVARQDEVDARENQQRDEPSTPPKSARTDRMRGTGSLGEEGRDPDMPLTK